MQEWTNNSLWHEPVTQVLLVASLNMSQILLHYKLMLPQRVKGFMYQKHHLATFRSLLQASEYTCRCCLLYRYILTCYCQVTDVLYQADGGCPRWCSVGTYSSRFSPSGDRVLSVKIQKLSLSLLRRVPPWWIFSMPLTSTSFVWWSRWQKWAATGLSVFFGLDIWTCSFILMCRGCFVSPTYCRLHLLHVIRYTRLLDLHGISLLILYVLPVVVLENVLQVTISAQHLQFLPSQGELPARRDMDLV